MEEFGKLEERVVLVVVQTGDNDNVEESLDELEELASTAGAVTVGKIIQNREAVHPGTYIGKGKIEEVRALVYAMDATGITCDDELSPAACTPSAAQYSAQLSPAYTYLYSSFTAAFKLSIALSRFFFAALTVS